MGESASACLMQPFCYVASALSDEPNNQSNPLHHALGQSVSFGRFVSDDSLAWEKWSTFNSSSQNRYVKEAERFSRPGSVAQKKAFFEAHYKKLAAQKAAALLEQENNAAAATQKKLGENLAEEEVDHINDSETTSPKSKTVAEENSTAQMEKKQLENVDSHKNSTEKVSGTPPIMNTPDPDFANKDSISPNHRKRSNPKMLRVSLNFVPIRKINKLIASVTRKFGGARVGAGSSTASKDNSTPPRISTKAGTKEFQKHSSLTRLTEKKRNKTKSPVISSPFSLMKTQESAAACGNKKLEEKLSDNEAQNMMQLNTKLKDKAKKKIRKLRHRFCFKARPLPDFYNEREASKREIEKGPLTPNELPIKGRISGERMVVP